MHSQQPLAMKSEAVMTAVSTSGAPLSPLVEPHSHTSNPVIDDAHLTNSRRHIDDGKS